MAEGRQPNPLVDQFRKGAIPRELRLMAAQGALPLKPADLVELLHLLLRDREEDIKTTAEGTLVGIPAAEMLPILKDRETPEAVLAWAVTHRTERELREVALQNTSTPDQAIEALAPSLPEHLAELVVINQVRLLRRTSLLEALETNRDLSNDQRRRLRELRETFRIGEAEPPEAPPASAAPEPAAPGTLEAAAAEAIEETLHLSEEEAKVRFLTEEERAQEEKVSTLQRIYRLNTADKVVTALKGSREERAILIRDPNRIVSTAVLGSPRLTDTEIESFAGMKNISDEVLRHIGNHREYVKRYGVVSNLVRNPRTPLAIAIGMVSRLNPRDIKSISVDRNVSEVIRRQALKFVRTHSTGGDKK